MSHQHFYSRVPSRVSLFNKIDGFDTFAHSASLSREFILGELSAMYWNKLEIHNPARLRRGEIPTVYSQAMLPSGRLVQTVISYLPKDFTGERSAYLAHSLVMTDEERNAIFNNNEFDGFTKEMFVKDISLFNLTSRDAIGNPAIADRKYIPHVLRDGRTVISEYNQDMIKSFVFSLAAAILGDGRDVYFRLPYEDHDLSDKALEFINAIMSILPYGLRQKLSFATYVSTPDAYKGFKLKCVSSDCKKIAPEIGVFYDFSTGEVTGQAVEYQQYKAHSAFLYSLFEYRKIRDEFHIFMSKIEAKYSDLKLDVKHFTDIIFLFWQCCGFYVEDSVIVSDQSMCDFLDIYAAYREGIEEPHRERAYRPLGRYLKEQIAIPDGVYTRLSRLYPGECVSAKAIALDIVLGLIHVDVMRERLFAFISRNYVGEIDKVKAVINANLCRVFYGGFLQARILGHFDRYFDKEPISTRDFIIDKLLLSIRTPEIQGQIVAFIDKHYKSLTSAQRLKLCSTCLEMMPECDQLSALLVGLINHRICKDDDILPIMANGLIRALDANIKSGDWRLTAIYIDNSGYVEDLAMSYILGNNIGVDILISLLADMPARKRADKLIRIARSVPKMKDMDYAEFITRFVGLPVRIVPSTMYDIIGADKNAAIALNQENLALFKQAIIYPSLLHTLNDAFKLELEKDGVEAIVSYVENNPALTETSEYRVILDYIRMVDMCNGGDTEGAFAIAYNLPRSEKIRKCIADHLEDNHLDTDSDTAECTYMLLLNYLRYGAFNFDDVYSYYQNNYEEIHREEGSIRSKIEPNDRRGAADAAGLIISCASDICDASSELGDMVASDDSGLRRAMASFVDVYGLGAGLFLKKHCEDAYFVIGDIADELIEERNASINSVEDAVNLVLRRKQF